MRRVIGFAFLCIAAGMVLNMLLPHIFVRLICTALFALAGYELFCCGSDKCP